MDNMKNYIFYNDTLIPEPTPLVALDQDHVSYNRDWAKNITINLAGQLTGDYENIRKSQSGLLDIFNKNFGDLEIYEKTGSSNLLLSGSTLSYTPVNITGELPYSKFIILEVDGCYSASTPVRWEISNNLVDWYPFYLYKIKYYSVPSAPCLSNRPMFSQQSLFNQPLPYTGTLGIAHPGGPNNLASAINLNTNALGVYSGEYPYGSGKYIRLIGGWFAGGGSAFGIKCQASGDYLDKIYNKSGIIIRSINFEESPYFGITNYDIELNSVESSGNVLEPKNEFSFTEEQSKTLRLSHSVSARGISTNKLKSNALDNAINFVRSYTGLRNLPSLKFISGFNNKFYLQSFSESIDRLNSSYSVQEEYLSDLFHSGLSGLLNYNINIDSGVDLNAIQLNIRGTYKGDLYGNINLLRNTLNVYNLITGVYSGYINPTPIQYNITENTGENSIAFDYSFDNINLPNPYFKYDGSINMNRLDQVINIQARGEMIARGNIKYRSSLIDANVSGLISGLDVFASGLLSGFKDFNSISLNSNLRRNNVSINKNKNEGTLNVDVSYDDKDLPSGNFMDASYAINIQAPYWYMNNIPTCNIYGYHIINDFDITSLPKASITVNCGAEENSYLSENALRQQVFRITSGISPNDYQFSKLISESENINKKYSNLDTLYDISYNITKTATDNEEGLLPKFNSAQ